MEYTKLYKVSWNNDETEFSADNPLEVIEWFRGEFSDENGIAPNVAVNVERIGYTFTDWDYVCDYRGDLRLDKKICTIEWCMEDLVCAMARRGIEITDENIEKVLANRFESTLQERSTEEGWKIIDAIIDMTFD